MDRLKIGEKIPDFLKKYRYVILVILLGVGMMCIPARQDDRREPSAAEVITAREQSMEQRLEEVLAQIEGAGKVRVLLTEQTGQSVVYQTDRDSSHTADTESLRSDTVIITDGERAQQGLIRQINPPVYLGAVVVCQGAESATVRLAVVQAVSNATGLGADKISVLKMK